MRALEGAGARGPAFSGPRAHSQGQRSREIVPRVDVLPDRIHAVEQDFRGTRRQMPTAGSAAESGTQFRAWCRGEESRADSGRIRVAVPMIRTSGANRDCCRYARPGSSLRLARSPVAPNNTITCGASGSGSRRDGREPGDG